MPYTKPFNIIYYSYPSLIFKTASIAQDRPVSQSRVTLTRLQLAQSAHPDLPSFYLAISKNRQCQLRRLLLDGDVGDFIE